MKKSSKRQRGPVTEEISEAPNVDENIFVDKEQLEPEENAAPQTAYEPLEPEEVGISIYVHMPKHCKTARKLAAMQFKEGKVSEPGTVLLPDGKLIKFGMTVKTEMLPALKIMLRDGVFLAGKAPRKEGAGARKVV